MNAKWPPNPQFPLAGVMRTSGVPSNSFGADGWLATDPDTGAVYLKSQGAWLTLPVGPNEVVPLIRTTPASAAEKFGVFTYGDLPGVSGAVTFNHAHCLAGFDIESTTLITSMSWPNLIDVDPTSSQGGYISIVGNTGLISVSFPNLVSVAAPTQVNGNNCSSLVNVSIPKLFMRDGSNIVFSTCALSAVCVNAILLRAVSNPAYASGTITLDGGSNAAPTGQGIADKATLIGRGVTVTTN